MAKNKFAPSLGGGGDAVSWILGFRLNSFSRSCIFGYGLVLSIFGLRAKFSLSLYLLGASEESQT